MTTTEQIAADAAALGKSGDARTVIDEYAEQGILAFSGPDMSMTLDEQVEALCFVVQQVCSLLTDETLPAMRVMGQLVGGLFGTGTTAEDEMLAGLYDAGRRLRERIGASA